MKHFLLAAAVVVLAAVPAAAQDKERAEAEARAYQPQVVTTRHSGTFGGQRMTYSATIGETLLKTKAGVPEAAVVTTAYIREPRDPSRPVTFLFNGGPGSGSVWLQMGAFGPKRVAIPSDARDDGAPPYPIVDNPDSLLDVTDLVFIDPPGTGFSVILPGGDPKNYYGAQQDARAVAEVIRGWLGDNGRWNSPKYLGGESYGTFRAAAVANQLINSTYNDVALNGILLISTILDYSGRADTPGNEVGYITTLPSLAVTAAFHGKAPAGDPATIAETARQFATGPYAAFLLKGQKAPAEERALIRRRLAQLTGLSETYLEQADLRVSPGRFYKELLRDRGQTIGRLDTRYTGRDYDNAGENVDNDPSFYGIDAGYTAAINSWARDSLKFRTDREYQSIGRSVRPWDWSLGDGNDTYINVAPYIGTALRENAGLRVFVGQGWYDMATPFFGAEYSLSRTGIPQDRISYHYYDSGHMMYVRDEDRVKLSRDLRGFIRGR